MPSLKTEIADMASNWPDNALYVIKGLYRIYKQKYYETIAISNLNCIIKRGDIFGVVGASGSGKSTLLKIIAGILSPSAGRLYFNLKNENRNEIVNLAQMDMEQLADYRFQNIGFIFQEPLLLDYLTIEENLDASLILRDQIPSDFEEEKNNILIDCGIESRRNFKIGDLSTGERQRAQIASILILKPKIILADEPTGNLDVKTSLKIFELISKINKKYGTTFIIATHDSHINKFATEILSLEKIDE